MDKMKDEWFNFHCISLSFSPLPHLLLMPSGLVLVSISVPLFSVVFFSLLPHRGQSAKLISAQ